jgi:hypothetical protein
VARWLLGGVGVAGGVLVTVQPTTWGPILVSRGVRGGLPLLLVITLALVAVFSPYRARRSVAEKILDQLLNVLIRSHQQ